MWAFHARQLIPPAEEHAAISALLTTSKSSKWAISKNFFSETQERADASAYIGRDGKIGENQQDAFLAESLRHGAERPEN